MRYSQLFGKTTRSISKDVCSRGHEYLLRGGFFRESSAGRFYMLPLGMKVQEKICTIIEEEMDLVGAQRILAPILHPRELWAETKRTESVSFELMQVKDRSNREFILGGTAEEMIVELVRQFACSVKDLPFCLYQFSTKFRDELRARAGLLRAREFLMKDGYSFHANREDFEEFYTRMKGVYSRIFARLGLRAICVAADNGYMGGDYCHEFIVEHEMGESKFLVAEDQSYSAHEDIAEFQREVMNRDEAVLDIKIARAERGITIAAGEAFYHQPAWRQIKSLIYVTDTNQRILVCLRGDLEVNENKLCKHARCNSLRLATEEEVRDSGSVTGFVSPLKVKMQKYGDLSLETVRNFYTGADELHVDTLNVNYGRDFQVDCLCDLAMAREGHRTIDGSSILRLRKGVEVGNIFQLGTWYCDKMQGASFTGTDGAKHPYYMGCYGIGVGRTLATIAELHHDEKGLRWPAQLAPYNVSLLQLGKDAATKSHAEKLYRVLQAQNFSVLFDDRDISAGVKFTDAELIGASTRVIASSRNVDKNCYECSSRDGQSLGECSEAQIVELLRRQLENCSDTY